MKETLTCNACHTEKDTSEFSKNKTKKRGYNYKCKECHKEYLKGHRYEPSTQPQVCQKCSQLLPAEFFHKAPSSNTGRSHTCKDCVVYKPYSEDNAKHKRVARNRTLIRRYKTQCGCAHCGHVGHPSGVELDLDHVDPSNKDRTAKTSSGVRADWGRKRLTDEIRKCQVLCANCHRKKTYLEKEHLYDPNDQ